MMNHDGHLEPPYGFGPFLFDPHQGRLLRRTGPVPLGSRARGILQCLLQCAGQTVPKRELMQQVWGGALVEEGTLRVHVAALRRALGEKQGEDPYLRYVENVTGIGYRFIAPVSRAQPAGHTVSGGRVRNLPMPLVRVFGRQHAVSALKEALPCNKLMTVVGPGGIGKTTVAIAAAHELRSLYPGGVHYVDTGNGEGVDGVECCSSSAPQLWVLDNCEHAVEATARWAERLLAALPHITFLTTSREPLRAHGEWVLRLEPLGLPPRGLSLTAAEALTFPAIELFVDRAQASQHGFTLSDASAPLVAQMCQRLDGLPLAIELAAARVALLGIRGLAQCLGNGLGVLNHGRRTAVRRHQSLRASFDWSYALLTPAEQRILTRLALFEESFLASSALQVAADTALDDQALLEVLGSLAAKSLLTVEASAEQVWYRLSGCCRAFALEKFASPAEGNAARRRHAELCGQWVREWARDTPGCEVLGRRYAADIQAARQWCLSPGGDWQLGLDLTDFRAAAAPQHRFTEGHTGLTKQAFGALSLEAGSSADPQSSWADMEGNAPANMPCK